MFKMSLFDKSLEADPEDALRNFISPVTPYLLCDHFLGTELHKTSYKYIECELKVDANDLLRNNNYHIIKDYDVIQIQVDYFEYFYNVILPFLVQYNKRVVIITSQWHLPQVNRNSMTDDVLKSKSILLWISQNPIYPNQEKYMAFPYGICQLFIVDYIKFLKTNAEVSQEKTKLILNHCSGVHRHLPSDHIRRKYEIFGSKSGEWLNYTDYLKLVSGTKFMISTPGDRQDTYRHYECIGLDAVPISNVDEYYKNIFGENMVYREPEKMVEIVQNNSIDIVYFKPDKDILTVNYWATQIKLRIDNIKKSDT